jgi:hypothetical protein
MGQARRRAADRGAASNAVAGSAVGGTAGVWAAVLAGDARGVVSEEAAAAADVSAAVGVRWFRAGGRMLAELASTYVVLLGTTTRTRSRPSWYARRTATPRGAF